MKTAMISILLASLLAGCNGDDEQVSATGAQPAAQNCLTKAKVSGHQVVEDGCK